MVISLVTHATCRDEPAQERGGGDMKRRISSVPAPALWIVVGSNGLSSISKMTHKRAVAFKKLMQRVRSDGAPWRLVRWRSKGKSR